MTDTTDKVAFAAAELNAASDALASAAAEIDALRAEVTRQTGIAVDHCARADAAERMVVELGAIIKEAAEDLEREDNRHVATGDTYDTTYVTETLKRGIAALSRTEVVAGRWVSRNSSEWGNMCDSLALFDGHMARVTAERDAAIARAEKVEADNAVLQQVIQSDATQLRAAIAARDEAVASCKEWGDSFDALYAECAAAERARDEVGIQLAAAQAEIARMRAVVEAARALWLSWVEGSTTSQRVREHQSLGEALTALDAVPGDALAPVSRPPEAPVARRLAELEGLLRDARDSFNGEGADAPTVVDRITAALEASGIDSDNVKGVE